MKKHLNFHIVKRDVDSFVDCYKACLVAKCYSQPAKLDYAETFVCLNKLYICVILEYFTERIIFEFKFFNLDTDLL